MTETTTRWAAIDSPEELALRLSAKGYLAGEGLVAAAFLALAMRRPLFLEGAPGVGKTDFARKVALALDARHIRLQCHAGIDATQALYDWNFPKQILALRAEVGAGSLYTEDYLVRRPILRSVEGPPTVLLIDEIDRADDEFEALLLEFLEDYRVSIPELPGLHERECEAKPLVVLTSNRTREVGDALKRRCLYHWIDHPTPAQEEEILRLRVPLIAPALAERIAAGMKRVRGHRELSRPPGVAESLDLATALVARGAQALTPGGLDAAISTVVKQHDDHDLIRDGLLGEGP
jgi:MoxR-like ATPase